MDIVCVGELLIDMFPAEQGRRLDEVYWNVGFLLPTGGDNFASPSDITPAIRPETGHPLGF